MLPCNVIVQDHGNGRIEICAMDPSGFMQSMNNPALADLSVQVSALLESVLERV